MSEAEKNIGQNEFERTLRKFLKEGREKLDKDLVGTKEAIRILALEKTKSFIEAMDKGLDRQEREFLSSTIIACMHQSFCYGYGVGKIEGTTKSKIYL